MSAWLQDAFLTAIGALSGFIDSIAGGGGLITLPAFTLALGPGPDAIGTNKIGATVGAAVALWVYYRKGHMDIRKSIVFALWIGAGSLLGSLVSPLLPKWIFTYILLVTCPVILWVVWRKDLWVQKELHEHHHRSRLNVRFLGDLRIILPGLVCGFYDGVWGPGGGTFMFLSLLFFARLPLFTALAASKLANTCSALVALSSYAARGYVHWQEGVFVALGIAGGAFIGANFATKNSAKVIRPVLVVVVGLLVLRLLRT